jgi:hypothetical protein
MEEEHVEVEGQGSQNEELLTQLPVTSSGGNPARLPELVFHEEGIVKSNHSTLNIN